MIVLHPKVARACVVLFLCLQTLQSAEIQMLPGAGVRVAVGNSATERFAVDVSSNLVTWRQMTNVAAAASQITFSNDPAQADLMRFFRINDGDETFAIAGYVDSLDNFGGIAGATITESVTGTSVKTDASGFFHFNQRFSRTNLPVTVTAEADYWQPAGRSIRAGDANTLIMFRLSSGLPSALLPIEEDRTYQFKVTGGPRAGLEYSMVLSGATVTFTGGITGQASYELLAMSSVVRTLINFGAPAGVPTEIDFGPEISRDDDRVRYFSGIPSTNGTLSGNGIVTWRLTNNAPVSLNGLSFKIGNDRIQFTNDTYRLIRAESIEVGSFTGTRLRNEWDLQLRKTGELNFSRTLRLTFGTPTTGGFQLATAGQATVTGLMELAPYVLPEVYAAPGALSKIVVTVGFGSGVGEGTQYTVSFSGGSSGTFTAKNTDGNLFGNGTYVYTPNDRTARLRLTYPDFNNDFDDMILQFNATPGSSTASAFTGTQLVAGTLYPFNGTFTYE